MAINDTVLVQSYPLEPLIRKVFSENGNYIKVWRGTSQPDDFPATCPKSNVFLVDYELVKKIKDETNKKELDFDKLTKLWQQAVPYYN